MSTLIVPAAGASTRFPNTRPKWMLTHPSGDMMLVEGLKGLPLDKFDSIYIVLLKSHVSQYQCFDGLVNELEQLCVMNKTSIVQLVTPTDSQPETVSKVINMHGITGSIFIKDCDDYFECDYTDKNSICTYRLGQLDSVHASNKSYVSIDDNLFVNNIAEKKVISDIFCCGGYSFSNAEDYVKNYNVLKNHKNLYTSHIILNMMLEGDHFTINECRNYSDWGTETEWLSYLKKFGTYFVDLDGVLVENSAKSFPPYWGTTDGIRKNIDSINKLYNSGKAHIVITTSRTDKKRTIDQLDRLGIKYHQILFGLPHCQRIVVNDYSTTNPYPSCTAINLERNSDTLNGMLP